MKILKIFAFFLFFVLPSVAQAQFTQVAGTIIDPNGIPYAGGIMNATLVPSSPGAWTLNGQIYSGRVGPVALDSNGHFSANFGDVTQILPPGAQWQITISSNPGGISLPLGNGGQSFTFTSSGTTISGSSPVDISTSLNALAPKLTNFANGGTVSGCSATGGIAYQNGTNNNLTCGANATLASTGIAKLVQVLTGQFGAYRTVDGSTYAQTAAGVQAAFTALGSNPGTVLLSPAKYAFGSTTVTVSHQSQNLLCLGVVYACEIDYTGNGSSGGIALQYTASGSELFYGEIGGLYFNGTGDTTHQKIAIQVVDISQFFIHDINIQNWTGNSGSSSTPSIGMEIQGREVSTLARVQINADRPINIDIDPNSTITFDAWHTYDLYLVPSVSTESSIVIAPGARITHWTWDGKNICALGTSCLQWIDTTAAGQSKDIYIANVHDEQSQGGASTYAFNIVRSNAGAVYIQGITFINDSCDASANSGWFLQRTFNASIIGSECASGGGNTALNADSTNFDVQTQADYFGASPTIVNSGTVANTDFTQMVMRTLTVTNASGGQATFQCPTSGTCGNTVLTTPIASGTLCASGSACAPSAVSVPSIAVASLPSAAANAGQYRTVSDSTTITVEGQTCVGSSNNTALAFSNGSVWKCF